MSNTLQNRCLNSGNLEFKKSYKGLILLKNFLKLQRIEVGFSSPKIHFFTFLDFVNLIVPPPLPLQQSLRYAVKDLIWSVTFCSVDSREGHFISDDSMCTLPQLKEEFPVHLPRVLWSVHFFTAEAVFLEKRYNKLGAKRARFSFHFKLWVIPLPGSVPQATCYWPSGSCSFDYKPKIHRQKCFRSQSSHQFLSRYSINACLFLSRYGY